MRDSTSLMHHVPNMPSIRPSVYVCVETYENAEWLSVCSVSGRVIKLSIASASADGAVTLSVGSTQDGSRDSANRRRQP